MKKQKHQGCSQSRFLIKLSSSAFGRLTLVISRNAIVLADLQSSLSFALCLKITIAERKSITSHLFG